MHSFTQFAVSAVALASSANAVFNPAAKTNVVTYWGQGPNQDRLLTTCQNPNIDVVIIGFVNTFPDQGPGGWPGTNFGNACWGDTYNNSGTPTKLLKTCPNIPGDVAACQQQYGKKIFLSIGGAYPQNYYINNQNTQQSAQFFASFLWSAFGPVSASKPNIPRPWGNVSVDGFDFDIENNIAKPPFSTYQTNGFTLMVNYFKNTLFPQDTSKSYYLSAAPQCLLPDVHLSQAIQHAWFDFVFIQFYNTPQCSARAGISHMQGTGGSNDITFDGWCGSATLNPNIKMYLGLPGNSSAGLTDPKMWLNPAEAYNLTNRFFNAKKKFGGIMVWEATFGMSKTCNISYLNWMKTVLTQVAAGKPLAINPVTCKAATVKGKKVRSHARDFAEWLGF